MQWDGRFVHVCVTDGPFRLLIIVLQDQCRDYVPKASLHSSKLDDTATHLEGATAYPMTHMRRVLAARWSSPSGKRSKGSGVGPSRGLLNLRGIVMLLLPCNAALLVAGLLWLR